MIGGLIKREWSAPRPPLSPLGRAAGHLFALTCLTVVALFSSVLWAVLVWAFVWLGHLLGLRYPQ